jgi:hypothetical protein
MRYFFAVYVERIGGAIFLYPFIETGRKRSPELPQAVFSRSNLAHHLALFPHQPCVTGIMCIPKPHTAVLAPIPIIANFTQ